MIDPFIIAQAAMRLAMEPLHLSLADLTLAAYAIAFVGGAAFIWRHARTDWRRHPWGRHVMAFTANLELLFIVALAGRIFGDYPGRELAVFLLSCTMAGCVWWRYALAHQDQRRQDRGDHTPV